MKSEISFKYFKARGITTPKESPVNPILFVFLVGVAGIITVLSVYQRGKAHIALLIKPLIGIFSSRAVAAPQRPPQPIELIARKSAVASRTVSAPQTTILGPLVALQQSGSSLHAAFSRGSRGTLSPSPALSSAFLSGAPVHCPVCGSRVEVGGNYCGQCGQCVQPDTRIKLGNGKQVLCVRKGVLLACQANGGGSSGPLL